MTCGENSEDSTKKTVRTDKWIQQTCKIQVQYLKKKKNQLWTFLVVQWLRVCLPMQGTWA